jgi:hypothetical protein
MLGAATFSRDSIIWLTGRPAALPPWPVSTDARGPVFPLPRIRTQWGEKEDPSS